MIIIDNTAAEGLLNAIIMWFGSSASLPDGWELYTPAQDSYVQGCGVGNIREVPIGSNEHGHKNQDTGFEENHPHTASVGSQSGASATVSTGFSGGGSSIANDHTQTSASATVTPAGRHRHGVLDTALADHRPPSRQLHWLRWASGNIIPLGAITAWNLPAANIPAGWAICNGASGTVNLTAQFVYGCVDNAQVGTAVGAETHFHTNSNTLPAGRHLHPVSGKLSGVSSTSNQGFPSGVYSVAGGGHEHDFSSSTNEEPDHDHTVVNTLTAANAPTHVLLYYIQRIT